MRNPVSRNLRAVSIALAAMGALVIPVFIPPSATAQSPAMQEKVAALKQSLATNKQLLAKSTWEEDQTISIKGEVKKQELFQVQIGPDGKPAKTPIDTDQPSSGRQRRLGHRIKEKITQEYEDYGKQIAALAQQYAHPDPQRLQQLFEQGNVMLGSAGAPGEVKIVIQGYLKQGDSMTIVLAGTAIQSFQVASYLNDPTDAVNINAQFAQVPNGGPNALSHVVVDGVSKHLTVDTQYSNYQPL